MIHIPRLVGVNHGGPNQGLFNISEMKTEPSDELIGEIKKLRRGSKIGIEFAEELPIDKIVIDGETIDGTTTGMHYWNAIIEACQRYGKEVCFLGDFDTYKNIWTLIHRELKIKQRILELGIDSPEAQPLFAERYAAQVLAEHAMVIGQDEALLKNIERYLPRIVIVGDAHANYFAAAQDQNGLSVGCYDREDVECIGNVFKTEEGETISITTTIITIGYRVIEFDSGIRYLPIRRTYTSSRKL